MKCNRAVATVSANDVWAVGGGQFAGSKTLIEHWNGTRWSVVKSPNPGSVGNALNGVAAISARDVWAVGYADSHTLTEHYHC